MDYIILAILAIVMLGMFLFSTMADDETVELTDNQAKRVERELEEARKQLIEREEKDVNIDGEE